MRTSFGILFLGMTVGGATFLVAGFASFLAIGQLQDRIIEARATQAVVEANQVSTRAKNAPVMADQAPYQRYLVSDSR
jgi:CHASE3 domain sensor protein